MELTRSASSLFMTQLITWRNPDGDEDNFAHWRLDHFTMYEEAKMLLAEGGVVLLTLTAVVESVFYATLALASYFIFSRCSDIPFQYSAKLLKSSCCTVIWGVINAVAGLILPNLPTRESVIRYMLNWIYEPFFQDTLIGEEDRRELDRWLVLIHSLAQDPTTNFDNAIFRDVIVDNAERTQLIKQGAELIKTIIKSESAILNDFLESETSLYPYILAKIAALYVFGEKKEEEIPEFFKDLSKTNIQQLRLILQTSSFSNLPQELKASQSSNPYNAQASAQAAVWDAEESSKAEMRTIWNQLKSNQSEKEVMIKNSESALETFVAFENNKANCLLLNAFKSIATRELKQGLLITSCWQAALDELEKENPSS